MRALLIVAMLVVTVRANAGYSSHYSSASPRRVSNSRCDAHDCLLPTFGIAFGGTSAAYLGAWIGRSGELPFGVHVGGAFVGGLSTVTGVLYAATNDPAPRFQTFGTLACFAVGVPSLILGVHGLVTAETDRDEEKPGPAPNWYGPSYVIDARGRLSPGLALGGAF